MHGNQWKSILVGLAAFAVAGLLLGQAPGRAAGTTLIVHSGAALRPAMNELGALFTKKTGVKVEYNYKGSGCLLPDALMSRKGDVYVPGELYFMDQAVDRKIVKPKYQIAATMTTVLVVQAGNPKRIKGLKDVAKPGVRLGLGDPKVVAIGRAAVECFKKAGVWERAQKNLALAGQNVSEVGNAVKMKHLDAAIIWDATASLYNSREVQVIPLPKDQKVCSPVPIGVCTFSAHPKEAQQYANFLASPEATKVFLKHGFGPPPACANSSTEKKK